MPLDLIIQNKNTVQGTLPLLFWSFLLTVFIVSFFGIIIMTDRQLRHS